MDRRKFLKLAGAAIPGLAATRALARMPQGLAGSGASSHLAQDTWRPNYGPSPAPSLRPEPVTRRLLVVVNNPRLPGQGNVRLNSHFRWNDPDWLVANHIQDLRHASFGYVNYVVADRVVNDDFSRWPILHNGFRHNEHSYLEAVRTRTEPSSMVNYHAYMADHRIAERVSSGQIDEVWDLGVGYTGMFEAVMAGPGASNSNGPPVGGTDHAGRRLVIMAYNFSRSLEEMLHSYGHRAEGHLNTVHSRFGDQDNLWRRFTRFDLIHPGQAEVGNIHFPPNGVQDYDYHNARVVQGNSDDWYHFPFLTGNRFRPISNSEWNNNGRLYLLWWMRHLPHVAGECDGVALNWWRYIVDPNTI
ncbi:MAG: hypothetical protein OXP68_12210 [Anaerolineaceae bacterium]|nr:hypothetical protein [Anaerolineaceae bacterium]MDE0329115.1 hypothetical protein [Anaerolineaceae bacterium]